MEFIKLEDRKGMLYDANNIYVGLMPVGLEVKGFIDDDKSVDIKDVIKLKECGFDSDDIVKLKKEGVI